MARYTLVPSRAHQVTTMQRVTLSMLLIGASLLVTGCGQTGDLYLPEPEPEADSAPQGEAADEEEIES